MIATAMQRVFVYKPSSIKDEVKLPDPDPAMSQDDVRHFYAATYPALTTATVDGPEIENDEMVFHFRTALGTKG